VQVELWSNHGNERLDVAIRPVIEMAGCLDETQFAASVARALRKDGIERPV
jgi:hypothetical protein